MTIDQTLSFAIIFGMMGLFAWGKLRYDLVALLALLAALAIGIVPADKAFDGFSDDIVIIVASALVVSAAVARSGVIERIVRKIGSRLVTVNQQVFALVTARRHHDVGRHLAEHHRVAHARGNSRAAFRHVRLHAGRRWLGAGRRGLSCLRLAALAA